MLEAYALSTTQEQTEPCEKHVAAPFLLKAAFLSTSRTSALTPSQLIGTPDNRSIATHTFLGVAPSKSPVARQAARVSSYEASGHLDRVVVPCVRTLSTDYTISLSGSSTMKMPPCTPNHHQPARRSD